MNKPLREIVVQMRFFILLVTVSLLMACAEQAVIPQHKQPPISQYQRYYLGSWQCLSTVQLTRFGRKIRVENRTLDVFDKTGNYSSNGQFLFIMNKVKHRYAVAAHGIYYAYENSVKTKLNSFELSPESETFTAIFLSNLLPSELALDKEKNVQIVNRQVNGFVAETVMDHVDDKPIIKTQCTRLSE